MILSKLQRKYGADGYRQPYFFMPIFKNLATEERKITHFNGKQMLDSRDMRLMLKVCDRTLIRWRNSGKLPYFKLSGKIYFWASDVHKFLREECKQKDFISASINS